MENKNQFFKIERIDDSVTKFTNYSEYICIISNIPIPPKRKYIDITLIYPKQFKIFDSPIDITTISIRFEKK